MLIIKIKSGLGNQLFQYAFGKALSLKRNEPINLEISYFENQPERDAKRDYLLDKFNIKADYVPEEISKKYNSNLRIFIRKLFWKIKKIDAYKYYEEFLNSKATYHEGYWLNEKYFSHIRKEIEGDFTLKDEPKAETKIVLNEVENCLQKNKQPVSLNIRRGDFVTNPNSAFNGVLGLNYYQKAIETLNEKNIKDICLFIFSDDIEWAKENLKFQNQMCFVSNPKIPDYEELMIISKCSHNIIANSTFSWWGAWLNKNPNKVVIAPFQWLKERNVEELDILPKDWIAINN